MHLHKLKKSIIEALTGYYHSLHEQQHNKWCLADKHIFLPQTCSTKHRKTQYIVNSSSTITPRRIHNLFFYWKDIKSIEDNHTKKYSDVKGTVWSGVKFFAPSICLKLGKWSSKSKNLRAFVKTWPVHIDPYHSTRKSPLLDKGSTLTFLVPDMVIFWFMLCTTTIMVPGSTLALSQL